MQHPVITEDWEDYDNRAIRDNRDRSKFSCDEPWEVNYLVDKLKKYFPGKSDADIRNAITFCCGTVQPPRPREQFVQCVVRRLSN